MKLWSILRRDEKIILEAVFDIECHATEDALKKGIDTACEAFDLPRPLILPKHHHELSQFRRTVFTPDMFVESIDFDSLEITEIVEKKKNSPV